MGVNDLQIAVIRHQLPEYAVSVMNECKNLSTNGTPLSTAMSLEMKPLSDQRNSIRIRLINGPDSFNGTTRRVSNRVKLIKTKPKETRCPSYRRS